MELVVLDATSIVQGDWRLEGPAWRVLAYRSRHGRCSLVVPEVVIRETVGRFREALAAGAEGIASKRAALAGLGVDVEISKVDVDAESAAYDERLRGVIADAGGTMPPPPDVNLLNLVDRAIARMRPFNRGGSGFRDALNWETVIELLQTARIPMWTRATLITKDNDAFWHSKEVRRLADALKADLVERGLAEETVTLCPTIADYLRDTGARDLAIEAAITDVLEVERAQIATNVKVLLVNESVELDGMSGRATIEAAHEPVTCIFAGAYAEEDDSALVFADFDCEADVDLYVEFWEPEPERRSPSWLSTSTTVGFGLSATFQRSSGVLDDFGLNGQLVVDADSLLHSY